MSDQSEYIKIQAAETELNTAIHRQEFSLVALLGLSPKREGSQWCILWGDDLQTGVSGFGDTPTLAVYAFNKAVAAEKVGRKSEEPRT
ncbi:MAG: hypothetical protein CMK96_06225 [Pseudomonas sp.]|nr:hypothetical protein [Pseudomonas sp.]QDP55320.1 MAG: hypothetical protein Tp176DCM1853251_4 [Prokaryotic dsDNA virus sp.]QDP67222.1 MAG: hypothetical protein GOVbin7368_13 [Prokaryotic dsDNA virus sp.]|tara:strand:- start:1360 stop:1623 length:264 start_codon:yes stop_codon:yes gene_type:complete